MEPEYAELEIDEDGDAHIPLTYPGQHGDTISLADYRHHKGWTASQNFRDQIERLHVTQEYAALLMLWHDYRMGAFGASNGHSPYSRFVRMTRRLLKANRRQNAMTD